MRLLALQTVLVATDLTETSDPALGTAGRLAAAAGAALHVVHAAPESVEIIARTGRRAEYEREIGAALRRSGHANGRGQIHVVSGNVAVSISSLADRIGADLVVLGPHREATQLAPGRPVGSTAYGVITRSPTPCLVVRRPLALPLRRTLVATDNSESGRGAMVVALSWTSALRSRAGGASTPALTVFHVDTPGDTDRDTQTGSAMDHELELLRRCAGGWAGVTVHSATQASAHVAQVIANVAVETDAELVVLGTRRLAGGGDSELGSISSAVARQLDIPVLLVPPAIWRSYASDLNT